MTEVFSHLYWEQILRKQQEPGQQWQHISPCWSVRNITGNTVKPSLVPSRPRRFRVWRRPSSLSGKFAEEEELIFSQQIMANQKWRRQAKNATSAKILEEMKKSVGNRFGFFNQRLPSNTKSCWRISFQGIVPCVGCYSRGGGGGGKPKK